MNPSKLSSKTPLKTSPRAIFYARVSTDHQTDNTSIGDQVDRGKAFISSQGWTLEKIFIENGESGKSIHRTAFQEMLSYLNDNPIDVLLVFKLDRLSRSLRDILNLIHEELNPKSIALQSVTGNFNSRSSEGMLLLQMLGSFAEFERKRINERTFAGKMATAKNGNWNGGKVAYGYRKVEGSEYDFDIHEQEAKAVKKIFQFYSRGYGCLKISKLIDGALTPQSISKLISNPFYCGQIRYNGIIRANNHPAIVSERLFKKCQKVRQSKQLAICAV